VLIGNVNKTLTIDNQRTVKTLESMKELYRDAGLDELLVGVLELLKVGHERLAANVLRTPGDGVRRWRCRTGLMSWKLLELG